MSRITLTLALLVSSAAIAQDVHTLRGLERGKAYLVEVGADGSLKISQTTVTTVGTNNNGDDGNGGGGDDKEENKDLRTTVKNLSNAESDIKVLRALGASYSATADAVANGSVKYSEADARIDKVVNVILTVRGKVNEFKDWRNGVAEALTKEHANKRYDTKEEVAHALREVATGIEESVMSRTAVADRALFRRVDRDAARFLGKSLFGGILEKLGGLDGVIKLLFEVIEGEGEFDWVSFIFKLLASSDSYDATSFVKLLPTEPRHGPRHGRNSQKTAQPWFALRLRN